MKDQILDYPPQTSALHTFPEAQFLRLQDFLRFDVVSGSFCIKCHRSTAKRLAGKMDKEISHDRGNEDLLTLRFQVGEPKKIPDNKLSPFITKEITISIESEEKALPRLSQN